MDDNKILISDDKGNQKEMNILFTFEYERKKYVLCYLDESPDDIYSFGYDDDGNMYEVVDEKENKLVNEVLDAFQEENEDEEIS